MTGLLLALALLQAAPVALEEGGSCELSTPEPPDLIPSRTGKFLALLCASEIQVLDAATFKPVRRLNVQASTLDFDATDATVTIVGGAVRRYDTKTWKDELVFELPDADTPSPGTALILREGQVWYRNKEGWISQAWKDADEVKRRRLDPVNKWGERATLGRFLADAGAVVLASTSAGHEGGIVLDGRFIRMPLPTATVAAAATPTGAVIFCTAGTTLYKAPSWKLTWTDVAWERADPAMEIRSAAVDPVAGIAFVSRVGGLAALDLAAPDRAWIFEGVKRPLSAMAVDAAGRRLFGLSGQLVRCWSIRPVKK